jgi:hypothetical protein
MWIPKSVTRKRKNGRRIRLGRSPPGIAQRPDVKGGENREPKAAQRTMLRPRFVVRVL